ncbi:hypothetical protein LCGC14_2070620 [marine sediment metagenome]|uniref:PglD N-terminal domain-containing protein n=1 Tax=marine sediment metagenome TaxID=412755 RepID=A0A0F9EIP0_9ZZZZ
MSRTIFGKGSHSLVVLDALQAMYPIDPIEMIDDEDGHRPKDTTMLICAIGDNRVRKEVGGMLTVIHPSATVSSAAEIGQGVFIGANVMIAPKAKIGNGVICNNAAVVEHECTLGDYCHIASGAVLSGNVTIGEGALIGANAVVKLGKTVGPWAIVGCGAVVIRDVAGGLIVAGNPAKRLM